MRKTNGSNVFIFLHRYRVLLRRVMQIWAPNERDECCHSMARLRTLHSRIGNSELAVVCGYTDALELWLWMLTGLTALGLYCFCFWGTDNWRCQRCKLFYLVSVVQNGLNVSQFAMGRPAATNNHWQLEIVRIQLLCCAPNVRMLCGGWQADWRDPASKRVQLPLHSSTVVYSAMRYVFVCVIQ